MDSFTGSSVAAKCNLCVPGSAAVKRLVYYVLDSVIAVAIASKNFLVTFLSLFEFHYFFVLNKLISTISEKNNYLEINSLNTHAHTHTHTHTKKKEKIAFFF